MIPLTNQTVGGHLLKWFTISLPTGPGPEPETGREVVLATGRAKWAS